MHPAGANPFYYLANFRTVLDSIETRDGDLLQANELTFIDSFRKLPRASQALMVRMVMRKGALFRLTRLRYEEIGSALAAMGSLLDVRWACIRSELSGAERARLFSCAEQREGCSDTVVDLLIKPLCERFRILFFGNFHQDWSAFVLGDLGLLRFEPVALCAGARPFANRAQIDAFFQLHRCSEALQTIESRSAAPPGAAYCERKNVLDAIVASMPSSIPGNEWIEQCRCKLWMRIAARYESLGELNAAHAIYAVLESPVASIRLIRLLERSGRRVMAARICREALRSPCREPQRQMLEHMGVRLLGARPRAYQIPVHMATLDEDSTTRVEELARRLLERESAGSEAHYVENALLPSLFGLLCWRAVFAPLPGAFFHAYQRAPADFASGEFASRRRGLFEECLRELDGPYASTILENFALKARVQCPFIAWGFLSERLLRLALDCIPAADLRLWFEWILRDAHLNRCGFPDLVQFWPRERRYALIEVKGPGDRLQDNQRRLLNFAVSHGLPVRVIQVRWDATMVPAASPKPMRREACWHQPRKMTVSPSSRKVRVSPAIESGSLPPRVNSRSEPAALSSAPDCVPVPSKSPGCKLQPLTV